jgi:hypothetical protein
MVMWISSNKTIVGDHLNGKAATILGWFTARPHGRRGGPAVATGSVTV